MKIWHQEIKEIELTPKEVKEIFNKRLEFLTCGVYKKVENGQTNYYRDEEIRTSHVSFRTEKVKPSRVTKAAIELMAALREEARLANESRK